MTLLEKFIVGIRCFTFNHASFIEKCMDGFCIQETSFPFICTIVDDFSTDGEPVVIQKYLQDNFDLGNQTIAKNEETDDYIMTFAQHKRNRNCFFAVYFLKYNHYSINKEKLSYLSDYLGEVKYLALCEGDDYWIDPLKLQHQFDYLEQHTDCTLTCSRAKRYSESKGRYVGEQYCRKSDGILRLRDIVNRTGLYIPTCSIMYRPWIRENYPDYCHNCKVGDYPLQITAAMKGSVYYFNKCMGVYRIDNSASWIGRQRKGSMDPARLKVVYGQTKMFEGFARDYPEYSKVFQNKVSEHILKNMPECSGCNDTDMQKYHELFSEEFSKMSLKWKFFHFICQLKVPRIKRLYRKVICRNYLPKVQVYDGLKMRALRIIHG